MITRRHLVTAALLATVGASTSCTRKPAPDPTTLPTPSGGDTSGTSATNEAQDEDDPAFSPTPTDAASRSAASDHATATLEALWATTKSQDQWYQDLAALMTPAGGAPFEYTHVENVVPGRVTGDPTVTFLDEGNTAQVTVPSTEGDWTLTLYRGGEGWLTESIGFPSEEG